jgi:hypothetical protein
MRVHPRQGFVVNTLAVVLIAVFICRAQSAQSDSAAVAIGSAKPLLLGKNEGELRARREVLRASLQSDAQRVQRCHSS